MSTDDTTLFETLGADGQAELIDGNIGRVAAKATEDDIWQVLNQHGDLDPSEIESIVEACQVCISGVVNGRVEGEP
jgi:hypothetical protein